MEQVLVKQFRKEEYRLMFRNFCAKARDVRLVTSELNPDPAALAAALLALEQARVAYNNSRDALGFLLLESSMQVSPDAFGLLRCMELDSMTTSLLPQGV